MMTTARLRVQRYLVYLNKRDSERRWLTTNDLCDQKTAPLTPKPFIYNRYPFSQAGRRRFESGLPLHVFNNFSPSQFTRFTSFTSKSHLRWLTTLCEVQIGKSQDSSRCSLAFAVPSGQSAVARHSARLSAASAAHLLGRRVGAVLRVTIAPCLVPRPTIGLEDAGRTAALRGKGRSCVAVGFTRF